MNQGKLIPEGKCESLTDTKIISMVVDGKLTRNRHFEFFKTKRGLELFKKATILKGFLRDLKNGAKITDENIDMESVLITIENKTEKYKRTVLMDKNMYSVFSLIK
ncbi:MAG TPA: hypothetical protein PKG52_03240 [bacterium]|nr:hypothetical protein [bacterium]HPS29634.1 hypothetical protein [bacterium]